MLGKQLLIGLAIGLAIYFVRYQMGNAHPVIACIRVQANLMEELADALNQVEDAQSAEALHDKIDLLFIDFIANSKKLKKEIAKHGEERVYAASVDAAHDNLDLARDAFSTAIERMAAKQDQLPAGFIAMLDRSTAQLLEIETSSRIRTQFTTNRNEAPTKIRRPNFSHPDRRVESTYEKFNQRYGVDKVVLIRLAGDGPSVIEKVDIALDAPHRGISRQKNVILAAPVNDFDQFCLNLAKYGVVQDQDEVRFELSFTPDETVVAEDDADHWGRPHFMDDEPFDHHFDEHHQMMLDQHKWAEEQHRKIHDRIQSLSEDPNEYTTTDLESARRLIQRDMRSISEGPPAPVKEEDHPVLASDLNEGDHAARRKAARRLLTIEPSDVADNELRKQIARGYRAMALDSSADIDLAVEGLIKWGGKYSVPVLIQVIESSHGSIPDQVFDALGKYNDSRAIEPLAKLLEEGRYRKSAQNALKYFGPQAEDALIQLATSTNDDAALAAIQLLGHCGTSKCYGALRNASKRRDPQIKEAVRQSFTAIRERS